MTWRHMDQYTYERVSSVPEISENPQVAIKNDCNHRTKKSKYSCYLMLVNITQCNNTTEQPTGAASTERLPG